MTQFASRRFTVEDYFRIEGESTDKHEFRSGEIISMAGGTPEHSLIIANIIGELRTRLKGSGCRVFDSNLRVRVLRDTRYSFPDVTVICGEIEVDPKDPRKETAVNPRVIVEVLSPSTELFDRVEKFNRYLKLESLQQYVLVAQDRARVETYSRQSDGGWRFENFEGLPAIAIIRSLSVELPLAEIYAGVNLPAAVDDETVSPT